MGPIARDQVAIFCILKGNLIIFFFRQFIRLVFFLNFELISVNLILYTVLQKALAIVLALVEIYVKAKITRIVLMKVVVKQKIHGYRGALE